MRKILSAGRRIGASALVGLLCFGCGTDRSTGGAGESAYPRVGLEWISPSPDGNHFVRSGSGRPFVLWGFNYDHDDSGRLLEDYWLSEWPTVVADFREMKALGANVVRIHLQVGKLMSGAGKPNAKALRQLARVVQLAEETGVYLDVTGLGCYRKKDVPEWYDALGEKARWEVQSDFWKSVVGICAKSPAVFCYDLMNEPVLPGLGRKETDWLAGEFGGLHFVQRLALDLDGRSPEQVARAWVAKMVAAIRTRDRRHMITLGEIPWAFVFPGAKPLFAGETGKGLDFVSVHFYPKKGEIPKASAALGVYDFGKPLVVEEMFPLECSVEELDAFIEASRMPVDGWIGFYWGKTIEDYTRGQPDARGEIVRRWLEYFRARAPEMTRDTGRKQN